MTGISRRFAWCVLGLLLCCKGWAAPRRDPLSQLEIDQLRDTAQEPDERLKLYVKFVRIRLDGVEQARTDPKVNDHAGEIHGRLQDFLAVYDELSDNVDMFADRRDDIRKSLKVVIEADTEFQAKLRALKDSAEGKAGASEYQFALTDAIEALDTGATDHRTLLTEQEDLAKRKKLVKATP